MEIVYQGMEAELCLRELLQAKVQGLNQDMTIQSQPLLNVKDSNKDRSNRVTNNLPVFGGWGLVLSTVTGLFGINVDGIPGRVNTPYAFGLFAAILVFLGIMLIAVGLLYLGLKKPISDELVRVRKLELQQLVKMFQYGAETHALVQKSIPRHNLTPTAADTFLSDADYLLIH